MNESDDLLSYLVEGLEGQPRDLVTRAFYRYAEGDPNSGPVNEAVLLTAFSRRIALAPREMREANGEFKQLLAGGREMEARIRERVELSNYGVVASFKDEATRAATHLRTTAEYNSSIVSDARDVAETMKALLGQGRELLTELRQIKAELRTNGESSRKIAEATETTKANSQIIQEMVSSLTGVAIANWITFGIVGGIVLTAIAMQLPWWGGLLLFAFVIGLLQLVGWAEWASVQQKAEMMKTDGPSKK